MENLKYRSRALYRPCFRKHPSAILHYCNKLLICCFEVNFLHKNPIIGQIWLIYINFQQNFPCFSSYVTYYYAKICVYQLHILLPVGVC